MKYKDCGVRVCACECVLGGYAERKRKKDYSNKYKAFYGGKKAHKGLGHPGGNGRAIGG